MTSKELAEIIGVTDSTVCDVIYGRNNRRQTQELLARTLGISADDMQTEPDRREILSPGSFKQKSLGTAVCDTGVHSKEVL